MDRARPRAMKNDLNAAQKPLLRLRPHYDPLLALWRHPALLAGSLLTPIFMLPELEWITGKLTGLSGRALTFTALISCFLAATGWPLFNAFMESRVRLCTFYADEMTLASNWLALEKTRVPYASLSSVEITANWMQRKGHSGDLDFMVRTLAGRIVLDPQKAFTLHDVRNPARARARIMALLERFRETNKGP